MLDSNNDIPFRRLPAAIAQQVLKQLAANWFSYTRATKEFFANPSKFCGQPRPPKYIKEINVISMDASRCFSIRSNKIRFTKGVLNPVYVPSRIRNRKIKLIRIVPHHNVFDLEFIYEVQVKELSTSTRTLAIDIGLNNFITTTNDAGVSPFIIKGGIIKSINQNYNKLKAKYQSELPKGVHTSKKIQKLGLRRQDQLNDQLHKISRAVVDYCLVNEIGTIVIGRNKGMKQEITLGKRVNQNFVSVPYYKFYNMIQYKCKLEGLHYIEVNEAYTSLCSYADDEFIGKHTTYAGSRISRGQFQVSTGEIVNADLNAAYNIHFVGTGVRLTEIEAHPIGYTVGSRSIF
jgi:putative transposase